MKYLTAKQVAQIIQASPKTIYAWAEQGLIPSIKINGLLRFMESQIIDWLRDLSKRDAGCYNKSIQIRSPEIGGKEKNGAFPQR